MFSNLLFLSLFLFANHVFAGVLILSPKEFEISSLKPFDETTYNHVKDVFKNAKIVSFKINSEKIPLDCEHLLQTKYTAYIPTINYIPENAISIDHSEGHNCNDIKKQIHVLDLDNKKNIVYLIIHNSMKVKRNAEDDDDDVDDTITPLSTTTEESIETTTQKIEQQERAPPRERISNTNYNPDNFVLYKVTNVSMMYSVRAPVLKIQNDTIHLGPAAFSKMDDRGSYWRMILTIPVGSDKISLRFRFLKDNGYWYLTSVEVEDHYLPKSYNLTIIQEVYAPYNFSYRCGGETVFFDNSTSTSLTLFDMQVQPQINPKTPDKFSDAYNCVPFMTGPIWSGIFVSSILCIGLIVGLGALGSIKTMDKFDNSKTKQLTITIMGE